MKYLNTFSSLRGALVLGLTISVAAAPAPGKIGKLVTFADIFSGNYSVSSTSVQWIADSSDGTYVVQDPTTGSLVFANIVTGTNETFVDAADIGEAASTFYDYYIQPSGDNVLFSANYTKQYRYSFFADYYIFNRASKSLKPLVDDQVGDIQYAGWNTRGDSIAYVRGNNLFMWVNGTVTQITDDGGVDVFNGVPDWVYEEEIYGDTKVLWFSPDGENLAFLRFNETGVPTYTIPYYMDSQSKAPPYPRELELRYPKVGETNPTATFHLLDLSDLAAGPQEIEFESFAPEDLLITEVAWVAEEHEAVIFRTMNRVQNLEKLIVVDVKSAESSVVRERDGTDGWIDNNLAIQYIPGLSTPSYIDISDHTGYAHLYLYPVAGGSPIVLTSGEYEVISIVKVDVSRNVVYYLSTERDSTERHLYSVGLDGKGKKALVDTNKDGYWAASFSDGGAYYILSYRGPDLPHQELYSVNNTNVAIKTMTDNAALKTKLAEFNLPTVSWSTLKHPDGYELNVVEYLPPNFDPKKKYQVLFDIYGGPGSQETGKTFRRNVGWSSYVTSDPELEYIILSVDNRGTGFKGRAFRTLVNRQLGKLEAQDQVWAAQQWAKKSYVDEKKIAIWGWSFGGYLTSKVLELDSGVFSLGLITAPVSDWRFYDSMYTERYMGTLEDNQAGYAESAVALPGGFKNVAGGFLVQHGTGDDNVHFQNSAALVDTLMVAGVSPEKMRVQWFTDSDHSINFHGGTPFLYKQLAKALYEEKERKETTKHQWSRRGE
ncbi:uncharacterized protein H6S33_000416 [Morchella sextelata]|uniref:uncharacterized protein n=1 Tax=Morchella sextelata TaxID=1174677 RepID=UPI001D047811|nr:uncharacterized protein H6S33_000416 [Morchella sextelata]KAH0614780.1 hypothetical protein H6S33_000416 [Morchella sextelata]